MRHEGTASRSRALRVVVAIDSFKGSVSSAEACAAAAAGVRAAAPDAVVTVVPIADGGEGTVETLAPYGTVGSIPTVDLLCRSITAPYVALPDAVAVESASTVGLPLLGEPSPELARRAHSYGLGLHLRGAARMTSRSRVLVGLGGTGTTDGGIGMLLALGARMWTADGARLWPDGRPHAENPLLLRPARVEMPRTPCILTGLADVASPLLGDTGAARLFGPQKGADRALVEELESAMSQWAAVLADAGADVASTPGAGAAGGLGAAVLALGGTLRPGLDELLRESEAIDAFADADIVLTGEGALDDQTAHGKAPAAVARLARDSASRRGEDVAVIALTGRVDADTDTVHAMGISSAVPIHGATPPPDAMDREVTVAALTRAAETVLRNALI